MLNLFGLFNLFFVFVVFLEAGSFENFKKREIHTFREYHNVDDMEFSSYLKKEWFGYSQEELLEYYLASKPEFITPSLKTFMKPVGPIFSIRLPKLQKQIDPPLYKPKQSNIKLDFFGTKLWFNSPPISNYVFYPKSKDGVAIFFKNIATSQYYSLVDSIEKTSKELKLNDWAKYLLIKRIAQQIYDDSDRVKLLSWFIFNKLGYDVKVGLHEKHIVLLFFSEQKVYQTPYYKFGNKNYFVLDNYLKGRLGLVYTYKKNYPTAKKAFDFSLKTLPLFTKNIRTKTIVFVENGKEYRIDYKYNTNIVKFLSTYPQVETKIYLQAAFSLNLYRELASALKKYTREKKASEAINFVLHFVQKGFNYKVDEKQFGRQKMMFAQESLHYESSDCEDRVVLFSYLIKHLFGISVVSVKYSDHMVAGLYIPIGGDSIKKGSRKFVIADPTYVNSNIGQGMAKYRGVKPVEVVSY